MKNILITNDDGITATGITVLARAAAARGHNVLVVAPDRERSASGHSMTMDRPLNIKKAEGIQGGFAAYSCDGTPTDCVIMGIDVLKFRPDFVISGINCGANLGDDVTYSGTVMAALEGLIFGFSSIAVSLVCRSASTVKHFDTAARAALSAADWFSKHKMPDGVMYNINVPNEPPENIAGVRVAKKGTRRYYDKITVVKTPFGKEAYWVGGRIYDEMREDTDVWAVSHNYISLTPLRLEMTSPSQYDADKKSTVEEDLFDGLKN